MKGLAVTRIMLAVAAALILLLTAGLALLFTLACAPPLRRLTEMPRKR